MGSSGDAATTVVFNADTTFWAALFSFGTAIVTAIGGPIIRKFFPTKDGAADTVNTIATDAFKQLHESVAGVVKLSARVESLETSVNQSLVILNDLNRKKGR